MRVLAWLSIAAIALAACDSDPAPVARSPVTSGNVAVGPADVASGPWTLDLRDGAGTVHVALVDLHGPLYRLSTPTGVPAHPIATVDDHTVAVNIVGGSTSIDIALNRGTPWHVQLSSGASTLTVDATQGTLAGLKTLAGVSAIDVKAGAPHGLVHLTEVGGASSLDLHVPDGTGVRVNADGGAGAVKLFDQSHSGVAGGTKFETPKFGGDGYQVDAQAGVSSIVVD